MTIGITARWLIRQALCGVAAGVSGAAVLSYFIDYKIMRTWSGGVEMSLPTAVSLFALSLSHFIFPSIQAVRQLLDLDRKK